MTYLRCVKYPVHLITLTYGIEFIVIFEVKKLRIAWMEALKTREIALERKLHRHHHEERFVKTSRTSMSIHLKGANKWSL